MLKRGHLSPARIVSDGLQSSPFIQQPEKKRIRDYASPVTSRNHLRRGEVKKDQQQPVTPLKQQISIDNMKDDDEEQGHEEVYSLQSQQQQQSWQQNEILEERRSKRTIVLQKKRNAKQAALLSPAPVGSPKALVAAGNKYGKLLPSPLAKQKIKSQNGGGGGSASHPTSSPVTAKLSLVQMSTNFEKWMKEAADNKINAKNTWHVALIDYFHELAFLGEDEHGTKQGYSTKEPTSINFQRASCTLDGCVKIYSSRVDSVADATNKLLSGLTNQTTKEDSDNIEDVDQKDNKNPAALLAKAKKRAMRKTDTLEKSWESITLKKLDLTPSIDPFFRKLCSGFEERGLQGMLTCSLNQSLDGTHLIFDSDEVIVPDFPTRQHAVFKCSSCGTEKLDIDLPDVLPQFLIPILAGEEELIMQSNTTQTLEDLMNVKPLQEQLQEIGDNNPFFQDDLAHDIGGGFDDFGNDGLVGPAFSSDDAEDINFHTANATEEHFVDELVPEEEPNLLAYFDNGGLVGWAGPDHWKLKKRVGWNFGKSMIDSDPGQPSTTIKGTVGRPRKPPTVIDFFRATTTDLPNMQKLFKKPANPGSITLNTQSLIERTDKDYLLPEDFHFNSANLLGLFLIPSWRRKKFGQRRIKMEKFQTNGEKVRNSDPQLQQLAPDFWATEYANDEGPDVVNYEDDFGPSFNNGINTGRQLGANLTFDEDENKVPLINFNQQNLDSSGIQFTTGTLNPMKPFIDGSEGTTSNSIITGYRPIRHVNIQSLKERMWNNMGKRKTLQFSKLIMEADDEPVTEDKDNTDELSMVPHMFICLLHLANEHDLEIKGNGLTGDLTVVKS